MTLRQLRNEFTVARKFESADCRPILGWVDPDFGRRGERLRNACDEPLGVTCVRATLLAMRALLPRVLHAESQLACRVPP